MVTLDFDVLPSIRVTEASHLHLQRVFLGRVLLLSFRISDDSAFGGLLA